MAATARSVQRLLQVRLAAVLTGILIVSVMAMSLVVTGAFSSAIEPELENRTRLIGVTVRSDLQRILQSGIPLRMVGGLETYLDDAVALFPEVRRVTVSTDEGQVVAEIVREALPGEDVPGVLGLIRVGSTQFTLPVILGNSRIGQVDVESSPQFVRTRLRDIFFDIGVLSFLVLLIGVEVALLVVAVGIWKPYARLNRLLAEQTDGRFTTLARVSGPGQLSRTISRLNAQVEHLAQQERLAQSARLTKSHAPSARAEPVRLGLSNVVDMRLVLFVFVMGAEITASFLPIYGAGAIRPDWMGPAMAAAMPVAAFLIGVSLLSPFAGGLARRYGAQRLFLIAAVVTAVALAAMALGGHIYVISAARFAVALSYAMATISCHQYARAAEGETRDAGQESGESAAHAFYAMTFGGLVGGSALGGITSALFSPQTAIALGGVLVLVSAAIAQVFMNGAAGAPAKAEQFVERARHWAGSTRWRLTIMIGLVGAPVAAATAILVWYLTPLMLSASGSSGAEIGRVVMLYYVMLIVLGPLANGLQARMDAVVPLMVFGLGVSAVTLFLHQSAAGLEGHAVAMAGLGIGHAFVRAPLSNAVTAASAGREGPVNLLRLVERLGGLVGLVAGAFLFAQGWTEVATKTLAGLSIAGGVLLYIQHRMNLQEADPA